MKKKKSKKKTSFISKTAMTVLTIILIILFFCIMSMVEKIQGTARVVNYAGLEAASWIWCAWMTGIFRIR